MYKLFKKAKPGIFPFLVLSILIINPSQVLSQELVGHWSMEESSGATVLIDSSSYTNDAAITGSLIRVAGQRGFAQEFDGTGDYALVPDNASLDITSAITLAAWIKPSALGTQYIIKKSTQGLTDGYELSLSSAGKVFVRFNQITSGSTYRLDSSTPYPTDGNTWMHIAATFDGTNIKLYIDGTQEGEDLTGPGSIAVNDLSLSIGAQNDGARKFNGAIDDVRIYNYALSLAEIEALTTTWIPPEAPVLLSPADMSTGISTAPTLAWNASTGAVSYHVEVSTDSDFSNIVYNQSGIVTTSVQVSGLKKNAIHYWRVNATSGTGGISDWSSIWSFTTILSTESNGAGYATDLDGADDYIDCGNSPFVDITGAITLEAWISPDVGSTQSIIKKNTATTGYELSLAVSGKVFFRLNGTDRLDSGSDYIHDGSSWTHVAATYNGATMKLYMNGILEGTLAGPTSINSNSNNLVIGSDADELGTKLFNGRVDEVRLWNVERSESEIREYMCKKISGTLPGSLVGYWRCDEPEGNLLSDLSSNNNDGLLVNHELDEQIWSGAPIGDASAYDFDPTGGYTISLSHSDGDALTATTTAGTIDGILIYRVDANSVRSGSTVPTGYNADPLRYWGVRVIGSASPTYDAEYNYSNHPGLGTEADLRLVKRNNISDPDWLDASATLDVGANTLTLTNQSGTEYALASTSAALPVELNSFSAKLVDNEIHLKWQTETEVDNYGFEIERAGIERNWTKIGFIEGHGNSNSQKEYSFIDKNLSSNNYAYRLKQIDTDGSFSYSKVVEIDMKLPDRFHLSQNYPNPFNPTTVINYELPEAGKVIISIFDILGNEVKLLINEELPAGNYKVEFDATGLPSGIYFYRLQAGDFIKTRQMLLLK